MRYVFGPCVLDTGSYTLSRSGVMQHVEPQVLDVLRVLVENAGMLVAKDALVDQVWGGRIVSDAAISSRISTARTAIGDTGARQDWIQTVPRRGFRFVGSVERQDNAHATPRPASAGQRIGFCTSADGTRLAYARHGTGPALVRAPHWLTHLEHDWNSPVWRPILDAFGADFAVLRFDQRGNGLSEANVSDLSLDVMVADMEAVVDAAGYDRFVLYGTSQGVPVAVAYARRHPDRVSHLILHGGFARGRRCREDPSEMAMSEALITLIRDGWGREGTAFNRAFAAVFLPDGSREQISSLADMQRLSLTVPMAAKTRAEADGYDVSGLLHSLRTPTLVLHARNDAVHPLSEGIALASGISGARFVQLDSANHVPVPQEPAWQTMFHAIRDFLAEPGSRPA